MQALLRFQGLVVLHIKLCFHGLSRLRSRPSGVDRPLAYLPSKESKEAIQLLGASNPDLFHPLSAVKDLKLEPASELWMGRLVLNIAVRQLHVSKRRAARTSLTRS